MSVRIDEVVSLLVLIGHGTMCCEDSFFSESSYTVCAVSSSIPHLRENSFSKLYRDIILNVVYTEGTDCELINTCLKPRRNGAL